MTIYGYARVSTGGQDVSAQVDELRAAGCDKIHSEVQSGAKRNRPELAKIREVIAPGDVLIVVRLDRLARSTLELLTIADQIRERGAGLKSLREAWCDTTSPMGSLLMTVIAGMNEFERSLILERTGEGRERALALGEVRFGRPPKLSQTQADWVLEQRRANVPIRKIASILKVAPSIVARVKPQLEADQGGTPARLNELAGASDV